MHSSYAQTATGVLNLIDLAGSERLAMSGATGERLEETKHINKSLACLGILKPGHTLNIVNLTMLMLTCSKCQYIR